MCQDSSYNLKELTKGKNYLASLQKKSKYEYKSFNTIVERINL